MMNTKFVKKYLKTHIYTKNVCYKNNTLQYNDYTIKNKIK